ncbi:MAG: hypothetical protein JSR66_12555 [Proteobacteria bacterium]|nr:hypothetical protein [Pseudomonadota bacterium]
MTTAIRTVIGRPNIKVRRFPWALLGLLAPFKTRAGCAHDIARSQMYLTC